MNCVIIKLKLTLEKSKVVKNENLNVPQKNGAVNTGDLSGLNKNKYILTIDLAKEFPILF